MSSILDQLSVVEDKNAICILNRHESMGHSNHRTTPGQSLKCRLKRCFGSGIQGGRGLVEDPDRGITQNSTRNRNPLFLPTGESTASLTHHGVIPV